jgi:hypothetical protein
MAKTYLGSDLKLEGDIKSQGDIEIDGEVKGQVTAKSVNVLGAGNVDGSVSSDALSVEGKVNGSVNTNDLTYRSNRSDEGRCGVPIDRYGQRREGRRQAKDQIICSMTIKK